MACDFVDLVQNGFCTRPVAHQRHDLAGLGPRYRARLGTVHVRRPLCLGFASTRKTGSDCFALAQKAEAPDDVQDAADRLTLFYTRNRYPDRASVEITGRKLNLLQSAAEEVLQWTRSTL